MESQVLSIDQMKRLIELGIDTSKASLCWCIGNNSRDDRVSFYQADIDYNEYGIIPTFTLQDIIDLVKSWAEYDFCVAYHKAFLFDLFDSDSTKPFRTETGETTIEAAFKLFKWIKENKYI